MNLALKISGRNYFVKIIRDATKMLREIVRYTSEIMAAISIGL